MPLERQADVLIVDDNPANLRLLSELLGARGYRVRAVTSGERALASIEAACPDIVLLDIRMPGMDGYEVCQRIKTLPASADTPIIFISALDEIEDKVRAFAVGGIDYIVKPFQTEEVIARLETHLSLRRLQRQLQEANRRMEDELALAARMQASIITRRPPDLPGWQLAVSLIPAKQTSGDFYEMIPLPDGGLGLVIADVVDKGVAAALYMAMSCALLRNFVAENPTQPDLVCQIVNERLIEYTSANQFVTVFLGILDTHTGVLTYSNAGHNPPVLLRPGPGQEPLLLHNTGVPLGIFPDTHWEARQTEVQPGDLLLLYTDGITEAENEAGDSYGVERLVRAGRTGALGTALAVRDAILADVSAFVSNKPAADDMALIVVRRG